MVSCNIKDRVTITFKKSSEKKTSFGNVMLNKVKGVNLCRLSYSFENPSLPCKPLTEGNFYIMFSNLLHHKTLVYSNLHRTRQSVKQTLEMSSVSIESSRSPEQDIKEQRGKLGS